MIRAAIPADTLEIAAMLGAWSHETFGMPTLDPALDDMRLAQHLITRRTTRILYGRDTVGFLSRTGLQLDALYLIPTARDQGLGRLLLNEAKAACDSLTLFTYEANLPCLRFFAREGFAIAGRSGDENDKCLPDLRLCWQKEPQ